MKQLKFLIIPCSESETVSFFFTAQTPSMLPVVLKAQLKNKIV